MRADYICVVVTRASNRHKYSDFYKNGVIDFGGCLLTIRANVAVNSGVIYFPRFRFYNITADNDDSLLKGSGTFKVVMLEIMIRSNCHYYIDEGKTSQRLLYNEAVHW